MHVVEIHKKYVPKNQAMNSDNKNFSVYMNIMIISWQYWQL